MNLKKYYEKLDSKTLFINKVCYRTGVSAMTVRNWIRFGMKPKNPNHITILSEETGIEEDKLW